MYASARRMEDLEYCKLNSNLIPLQLDVTDAGSLQNALRDIESQNTGLYGLVNNAGVDSLGLLATWSEEEMNNIFNVNVFGPWRVTNACLNLLHEAKGRIVNIGSHGGMVTNKLFGPYSMTKHAIEAYTDCLREELQPYGLQVSIIQPGGIASAIGFKSIKGLIRKLLRAGEPLKKEAEQILSSLNGSKPLSLVELEPDAQLEPSSPQVVADAVEAALFSPVPKKRYLIGSKWEGELVLNGLMQRIVDENDSPQHGNSREQLIALLDKYIS